MTPPIIKRYLIAFDQHKWTGVAACILILGASGFVAISQKPPEIQYQAEGILSAHQPPVSFSKTGPDIQQRGQVLSNVNDLLYSNNGFIIRSVGEKLKIKPTDIRKKLQVRLPKPPGKGEPEPPPLVRLIYTDTNDKVADLVNELMKGVIEQSSLSNKSTLQAIKDEINKRLPETEKELRAAEQKLQLYTKLQGPLLLAAENGSLIQGITGSQALQRQIQFQLQGIDSQIASLQQRLGLTPNQAYASSALSADPIIANLRTQIYQTESQLEILKKDLRPEHPNIVALLKQQQAYEQLLRQRAAEVIGGNGIAAPLQSTSQIRQDSSLDPARQMLAQQLITLQTQKDALQSQLKTSINQEKSLRQEYRTIPDKQLELSRLQSEFQLKQTLYSRIQASLIDAQVAEAETISSFSIVKQAEVSPLPVEAQNPIIIILIGAGAGLVVGGGLIFLLGSLAGILQTMEDIRGLVQEQDGSLLGVVPFIMAFDREREGIPVLVNPDSPYLEAYERFRSSLRRSSEKPPKVVLLTSTIAQEGKSVTAYNLGIASARAGKRTLVIEADLRSPSLAKSLKIAPDPDASVEPLRYYGNSHDCVRLVPEVENLYLIPNPGPIRQPAAILESSEFKRLLEDIKGRFDFVIIDAPALSASNDAFLLEPLTDGMVLVTRSGYTPESMLNQVLEELNESEDLRLLGVVINGADIPPPIPSTVSTELPESLVMPSEALPQEEEKVRTVVSAKTNGKK